MTVYGVVCAASLACYFNALSGDFVHDDIPAVTKNHDVLGTTPVLQVFANDFWGTPMSDPNSHKSYRPLTILTFRANYLLSGLQPVWYHAFNIILHAASCILFTRISLVVAGLNSRFATAAGLLFAVHPIHTEAVSGIVGRADVLACLLFLLSFLVYHDDSVGCTRKNRLLLSSLLAALSMLAKETGITVLLVNLLYDLYKCWPHVKRVIVDAKWNDDSIQFARRAAKIFMAMSVLLVFRLAILQGSLPKFSNQDNPTAFHPCPHVRLLTFCYLAAFNCWLLLCPSTLSHDWQMGSIPLVTSIADCRNIATCFFFGCCLLLAYRCLTDFEHQRHAPIVLGSLLLVIPFLPATNILVTVGFVVAERILYIPSLGSVLLTVYGAQMLYNSYFCKQKMLFFLCFLLLIGGFSYKTTDRNRAWSSRESLVRSGINALPHNAKMHYNFANYLRDTNSIDQAISHYREALRLWPSYASAHNNLGTLMNSATEAEAHFQSAISISPGHVNAHYNLGQVYRKMNRSVEAVTMLERCLRLDSAYTPAYLLLAKLHNPTTARRLLYHVTRLHPNSPDYLAYYASWLYDNYYVSESLEYYTKALRLQHTHMTSLIGVAKCLRARGQIGRLQQTLIRWHLIKRSHSSRGRLVYAGELYIRSWDLYKQGQTTSSQLPPPATIASRGRHLTSGHSKRRPKWWRYLGSCNLTGNSCKHRQLHLIEQYQLTPMLRSNKKNFEDSSLSSTLCVENHDSDLTARPGR